MFQQNQSANKLNEHQKSRQILAEKFKNRKIFFEATTKTLRRRRMKVSITLSSSRRKE